MRYLEAQGDGSVHGEMGAWRVAPTRIAVRLLTQAVQVLPVQSRSRYREELDVELAELTEAGASRRQQMSHSVRVYARAWSLRRALLAPTPAEEQVR